MADPAKLPNRRLYYRQAMYLRIDLRVSGMRVALPCTLVDISGGGCQIHSRTMLNSRSAVEFDLPRPGLSSLGISGTVTRVMYAPENRMFQYKVEFLTLDTKLRDQLMRFVLDEQRRALKRVRSAPDVPPVNARRIPMTRIQELRRSPRAEINVPVLYSIDDSAKMFAATAIDISAGGVRLIVDQVLRQEWDVKLRFTLSDDVLKAAQQRRGGSAQTLRPFSELRLSARPLGGVKQSRSGFVQSLAFVNPDAASVEEIGRFVQATQLTWRLRS